MGETLLAITRRMFDTENQALELLSASKALRAGTLRIVADAAHHLLPIISVFREAYPGVQIVMRAGNTETVIQSLLSYDADLGVLGDIPSGGDFQMIKLNASPIIGFVAKSDPLARRRSLSIADLAQLPLVLRERGSKTREKLEARASAAGVALTCVIEAEGREAVREIVASGAGIGFVSEAEFGHDLRLAKILLRGPPMLMEESLIGLTERCDASTIRAFLGVARSLSGIRSKAGTP